jgi:hypothetical protein
MVAVSVFLLTYGIATNVSSSLSSNIMAEDTLTEEGLPPTTPRCQYQGVKANIIYEESAGWPSLL